ncbi:MAG: hypothetical protein ACK56I_02880, partial [bacterium]
MPERQDRVAVPRLQRGASQDGTEAEPLHRGHVPRQHLRQVEILSRRRVARMHRQSARAQRVGRVGTRLDAGVASEQPVVGPFTEPVRRRAVMLDREIA